MKIKLRPAAIVSAYGFAAITVWSVSQLTLVRQRNDSGWVGVVIVTPTLLVCALMWARAQHQVMTKILTIYCVSNVTPMLIDGVHRWILWRNDSPHARDLLLEKTGVLGGLLSLPWWVGTLPMIPLMVVVFPNGVPKTGMWRPIFIGQIISTIVLIPLLIDQNDGAVGSVIQLLGIAAGVFLFLSLILRVTSLIRMWITGDKRQRRSLRAFVFAAATIVSCYFLMGIVESVFSREVSTWINDILIFAVISSALPIGLGLGILRDRIYGIEVFLSRALVGSSMTLMIFGVYLTFTGLLAVLTGKNTGMSWISLGGVALVVAILTPLYRFVNLAVDHVLYGDRETPANVAHRIIKSFQRNPEEEVSETFVRTLGESLKFPLVELRRLNITGESKLHSFGTDIGTKKMKFNLSWSNIELGELSVSARQGEHSISGTDRNILEGLIPIMATALFAARATDEVTDSREQLITRVISERARLRRALHDPISPTLAGISLAAATLKSLPAEDDRYQTLLKNIESGSMSGIKVLEALLEELKPPELLDLGLQTSIQSLIDQLRASTSISFRESGWKELPVLDSKCEEVAYFVLSEALMNVARHSQAQTCTLSISSSNDSVSFNILDDGIGLQGGPIFGVGLDSIQARVLDCHGTFTISEANPQGCSINITLPRWKGEQ